MNSNQMKPPVRIVQMSDVVTDATKPSMKSVVAEMDCHVNFSFDLHELAKAVEVAAGRYKKFVLVHGGDLAPDPDTFRRLVGETLMAQKLNKSMLSGLG